VNARSALHRYVWLLATAGVASTAACGTDGSLGPTDETPTISGNVLAGLDAFEQECASCHSSRDGFDLAFFAFPDSTIIRRAVGHVDTATAHDIVAYIRTVRSLPTSRGFRAFQPGGSRASGDANFATQLFGADRWPAALTAPQLAAIDPLGVRIALDFPLWSFEGSNLDWMPDGPIDDAIVDYQTEYGVPRPFLESYYATRSEEDLLMAVITLRVADRDPNNPAAPCVMEPFDRFQPTKCFETRRWIASLAGQHMLRNNQHAAVHPFLHDGWWDVGFAAFRSQQTGDEVDASLQNWAQWMYIGWAFEPDRHASVYLAIALTRLGLPRHATFHALRSMVARPKNSSAPFKDLRTTAQFAPDHWTYDAVRFGFEHLLDRLQEGIALPRQDQIDEDRLAVMEAYALAARKLTDQAQRDELLRLRDEVTAGIDRLAPVGG